MQSGALVPDGHIAVLPLPAAVQGHLGHMLAPEVENPVASAPLGRRIQGRGVYQRVPVGAVGAGEVQWSAGPTGRP